MEKIRFIHLADVHLDRTFGSANQKEYMLLSESLSFAPFKALENLIIFCKKVQPHFILLAGDIFNKESGSLKARFALNHAFQELRALNINIYYAHGNHDPLDEKALDFCKEHENLFVFGENWEYFSFSSTENTKERVRIHGISHKVKNEERNLTKLLNKSSMEGDCLNIGVLHTGLLNKEDEEGKGSFQGKYAPCSLQDLQNFPIDYWALGHVHSYKILENRPLIVYSGTTQGAHINESGVKGCVYVEFEEQEKKILCCEQHSLAPVEWYTLDFDCSDERCSHILGLKNFLAQKLDDFIEKNPFGSACEIVLVRLCLHGRSLISSSLQTEELKHELCVSLHKKYKNLELCIHDIESYVRPCFDMENALNREDILGESLRVSQKIRQDYEEGIPFNTTSEDLDFIIQKYCSHLPYNFDEKEQKERFKESLKRAEEICINVLEPQE